MRVLAFIARFAPGSVEWLLNHPTYEIAEFHDELCAILRKEGILK